MLLPGWLRLRLSRSREAPDHPRRSTSLFGDLSLLLLAKVASRPSPAGAVVRAWSCRTDTRPIPFGQAPHSQLHGSGRRALDRHGPVGRGTVSDAERRPRAFTDVGGRMPAGGHRASDHLHGFDPGPARDPFDLRRLGALDRGGGSMCGCFQDYGGWRTVPSPGCRSIPLPIAGSAPRTRRGSVPLLGASSVPLGCEIEPFWFERRSWSSTSLFRYGNPRG
ncbi:hypothetical protein WYO_5503 [Methylobacterium sp. GXF4]|nr:hypothetical protein WYO_5503 [Methylobacterium sp. GXF4]